MGAHGLLGHLLYYLVSIARDHLGLMFFLATAVALAGNRYEILIDTSTIRPLPGDVVRIRLQFDTFFVRKDAALHNDFRQLVVRAPDVKLLPKKD